jgi:NAD+ kinase
VSEGTVVTVITHRRPDEVGEALEVLERVAAETGATLRFDPEETVKHRIESGDNVAADALIDRAVDLCLVLGGDGTILTALRAYAGTQVPVFAVNYGAVGFLATVDPDRLEEGLRLALTGEFDAMPLPAIVIQGTDGNGDTMAAINDVSIHRKTGLRVADLSYAIGADEIGRVRCDGLVVATPAGSTGYNLANGGPVMAWGVEGFVVSFIAPHSLTARTLVVAPNDTLMVENRSTEDATDVTVDGQLVRELAPEDSMELRFVDDQARLAQLPGATFYHRLREKFGRLAD